MPKALAVGYGFEAVLVLQEARAICGDSRFCGCAADALREAGRKRDADITRAVKLLKAVREPERIVRTILQVAPTDRDAFRRRMCADFDLAVAKLVDATNPNLRRVTAVKAAREAQNWANDKRHSDPDPIGTWEQIFLMAMNDFDRDGRARGIQEADSFMAAPRPTKPKVYG